MNRFDRTTTCSAIFSLLPQLHPYLVHLHHVSNTPEEIRRPYFRPTWELFRRNDFSFPALRVTNLPLQEQQQG